MTAVILLNLPNGLTPLEWVRKLNTSTIEARELSVGRNKNTYVSKYNILVLHKAAFYFRAG
jgi:hypothetical protein